jgi:hypothetical protein
VQNHLQSHKRKPVVVKIHVERTRKLKKRALSGDTGAGTQRPHVAPDLQRMTAEKKEIFSIVGAMNRTWVCSGLRNHNELYLPLYYTDDCCHGNH